MRRYVKELQPTSVFDLAAMVALYRPGPMDNIPAYIRRKHGQEPVVYLHPLLEPFLNRTYGIFVYQEDIMSAAMALGGFTGPEADMLGYAIRKKKSQVLARDLRRRAAERGCWPDDRPCSRPRAVRAVWVQQGPRHLLLLPRDGCLKANYTVEYMTSADRVPDTPRRCPRSRGMPPPASSPAAGRPPVRVGSPSRRGIRFGLLAVRTSVRARSVHVKAREWRPFRSLTDFSTRIDVRLVNCKVLESLARSAPSTPGTRLSLMAWKMPSQPARRSVTGSRPDRCSTPATNPQP
jgi:DNA polymerase-3 subunit alpha